MTLDELAIRHGTDKGTRRVRGLSPKGYVLEYEQLLADRRHDPLRLIEIGVRTGASLRMWTDYLPQAAIVGVDIDPRCAGLAGPQTSIVIGDQVDRVTLDQAVAILGGGVDVVIDDGSHRTADHVDTFGYLFPLLAPGGWYAIEDLQAAPATRRWLAEGSHAYRLTCEDRLAILPSPRRTA